MSTNIAYRTGLLTREAETNNYHVTFSSESPVRRLFFMDGHGLIEGNEILVHEPSAVDLDFLGSGRAPFLMNHDLREQIGVVDNAFVQNGQLTGSVRFSSAPGPQQVREDVEAGIRPNVSIGYEVRDVEWDGEEKFLVTNWRPFEASSVAVPADTSVGFGRAKALSPTHITLKTNRVSTRGGPPMEPDIEHTRPSDPPTPSVDTSSKTELDLSRMRADAAKAEEDRIREILNYGRRHNRQDLASKAVRGGLSVAEFRGVLLDAMGEHEPIDPSPVADVPIKDLRKYSIQKVLRLLAAKTLSINPQDAYEDARFEMEVSEGVSDKLGQAARGVYVPLEVLGMRTLNVTSPTAGGNLVGTDYLGSQFIEALRKDSVVAQLGPRTFRNLVGNVQIPRQSGTSTATWIPAEGGEAAESEASFDQVGLTPRDIAVHTVITRRLLQQASPDVDGLTEDDMRLALGLAIDEAALVGTGMLGQPTGITNTPGVLTANLATLNLDSIVAMISAMIAANSISLPNIAWVANGTGFARCRTTRVDPGSGERLLGTADFGRGAIIGSMEGLPFALSENLPRNLGAGSNLSALVLGAWSQLIIGFWGALDMVVDPYTDSRKGNLRITTYQTIDTAVRQPTAFVVASDLAAT